MTMAERHDGFDANIAGRTALTEPPPPLATKSARTAMTKCLNALDSIDEDERVRVIRALAALFGVGT